MNAENMERLRRAVRAAEADTSPPPSAWVARFLSDGYQADVAAYLAKLLEKLAAETTEPERSALLATCVGRGTKQERGRRWTAFLAANPPAWLRERRREKPEFMPDP
ncbi:MAG: hypothetical protein ACOY4D_03085 [Pseudomonadota bacterium]